MTPQVVPKSAVMYYVKIRAEKRGGHVHATFFTATREHGTYANSGELVFREDEWPAMKSGFMQMAAADRIVRTTIAEGGFDA